MNIFEILELAIIDEENNTVDWDFNLGDDYAQVKSLLPCIGGKWNTRKKKHEFEYNPKDIIQSIITNKIIPPKNPLAFFPTPEKEIDLMIQELDSNLLSLASLNILESSAGTGAIVKKILDRYNIEIFKDVLNIDAIELDEFRYNVLKNLNLPKTNVINDNFLNIHIENHYDAVVMNPPFSVEGDSTAYITHINHAWKMLKENGILISIVPAGWISGSTRKIKEFREFVYTNGSYYLLDKEAFKDSGTLIQTAMISVQKYNWEYLYNKPTSDHYKNIWIREIELVLDCNSKYDEYKHEIHSKNDITNINFEIEFKIKSFIDKAIKDIRESGSHIFFKKEDYQYFLDEFMRAKDDYR